MVAYQVAEHDIFCSRTHIAKLQYRIRGVSRIFHSGCL